MPDFYIVLLYVTMTFVLHRNKAPQLFENNAIVILMRTKTSPGKHKSKVYTLIVPTNETSKHQITRSSNLAM